MTFALWLAAVAAHLVPSLADEASDLAAARAVFERNVAAIQRGDGEAYLSCYLESPRLVRGGFDGPALGYDELAASITGDWPESLVARDLQLRWLSPGLVYGSYRYRVVFGGEAREGLSERLFTKTDQGWKIAVTTAFDEPEGWPAPPVALVGATVFDGVSERAIEDAVVVVRGGVIESVGPRSTTPFPDGVDVVDLAGRFVTPGLIDTHVHYSQTGWADGRPDALDLREEYPYPSVVAELAARPERFHRAFLHSGVTAVFDVGGYPWTRTLGARTELDPEAPHVVATGPLLATWVPAIFELPDTTQFVLLRDEESARRGVAHHAAMGSDAIKVWFIVGERTAAELAPAVEAVVAAAAEHELPVVVHATELEAARVAVAAGAHLLVHSVESGPVDDAFVAAAVASGVLYCPTLTVHEGYRRLFTGDLGDEIRGGLQGVSPWVRERVLRTPEVGPLREDGQSRALAQREAQRRLVMDANLRRLHEAGVPVVLGTDAGNPLTLHGPSVFHELEAMEAAGMAPLAVLAAATSLAARALGREEDLGRVAAGYVADLLVLDEDPEQGVRAFRSLRQVMRAGVLHERGLLAGR